VLHKIKFSGIKDIRLRVRSNGNIDDAEDMDDRRLLDAVAHVKERMDVANANMNHVSNQLLIESYIYELKSLHIKYDYLLLECKKRGMTAEFC